MRAVKKCSDSGPSDMPKLLPHKRLKMEPVVGIELSFQFSYEENVGFTSEDQELFGLTPPLPFQYSSTTFTDSFTDSPRLTPECVWRLLGHYSVTIRLNSPTTR